MISLTDATDVGPGLVVIAVLGVLFATRLYPNQLGPLVNAGLTHTRRLPGDHGYAAARKLSILAPRRCAVVHAPASVVVGTVASTIAWLITEIGPPEGSASWSINQPSSSASCRASP